MPTTDTTPACDSTSEVATQVKVKASAFNEFGFKATIEHLHEEIRNLYAADDVPWIIGYSGGKDSTATVQLTWNAIAELPSDQRKKTVYVISTDTLVENPVVAEWVHSSMGAIEDAANSQNMPFMQKMLYPSVDESFWVNLIGRGYPAPRPRFRWCTERLKIKPSNRFISEIVTQNGEAILCIGARKAESIARARVLERTSRYRVRDRLSPSATLPGCSIYTPVEDWTNDDIWFYLNNVKNPWGTSNKELMGLYAGATADGECPLVVDSSTRSCGDSRFGCWVCTLVDKDKSMTAMIHNDVDKYWLKPLLNLRNDIDFRNNEHAEDEDSSDSHLRDYRRMTGHIQIMESGKPVPGPYTQQSRQMWLSKLLTAQVDVRRLSSKPKLTIITLEELQEIRRIWVIDKHELEDSLPRIYKEATGQEYPGKPLDDNLVLGEHEMNDLADLCGDDRLHYELTRELLSITRQHRTQSRRSGLFDQLEKTFRRHYYDNKEDALSRARNMADERSKMKADRLVALPSVLEEETTYEKETEA